eukprot:UN10925
MKKIYYLGKFLHLKSLRQWKRSRGGDLGFNNPCVICHNRTLFEMVRLLPQTKGKKFVTKKKESFEKSSWRYGVCRQNDMKVMGNSC